MKEDLYRTLTILKIAPALVIILIVIVALVGDCSDSAKIDPLDNSIMVETEVVKTLKIRDVKGNGFRVTYSTSRPVTKARFKEIKSRQHVQDAFTRMEKEAPAHFGESMLDTDIYDFAAFAKKYDVDEDVVINCIFTIGSKKVARYARPNKNIEDSAEWIDPNTEQGVCYIEYDDIYGDWTGDYKTYRYWHCRSIYSMSDTDEKFAHFSESERE